MVRALRRTGLVLALPALVGLSTLAHWLAGQRLNGLWIMPDEAIYAARGETLWRDGPWPLLHGAGSGYGLLYPLLAGLPLSVGNFARGYDALKLLQALVMSLAAVPVFLYGRRLMPPGYALLAAALTVSSPLLLYSGLVMTEVLFYPLSALALLAVARAVETAAKRNQVIALVLVGLAIATRVQAVVFLGVFAGAVGVDALLARTTRRLRSFWPVWLVLVVAGVGAAAAPGVLGAYSVTLHGGYPIGASLRLSYYHFAYAILMVAVVPVAAAAVLLVEAAQGRLRDPATRALLGVTGCAMVLVCAQVGFFSARYAPHLLGRNLAPLPPLLFLLFAAWLARGAPRPRVAGAATAVLLLAIIVFAPWNSLIVEEALPDSFGLALVQWACWAPADTVAISAAALLLIFVMLPRRLTVVLPALVLSALIASSALASNMIAERTQVDQNVLVGSPRRWIDQHATEPVAYLLNDPGWNVVWQQRFWNHRINDVFTLTPSAVPGPMKQKRVTVPRSGRLPIHDRLIVSSGTDTFVGTAIAHQSLGPDSYGLTLWHLDRPPALSTITQNVKPNGDMFGPGQVTAFNCQGGSLNLTLLPKETDTLEIYLNRRLVVRQRIAGEPSWHGTVAVPPSPHTEVCHFQIIGRPLLGSTVIEFERPG
jgi:hypothetical protein